jgi:hypothetical protein
MHYLEGGQGTDGIEIADLAHKQADSSVFGKFLASCISLLISNGRLLSQVEKIVFSPRTNAT